MNCTVLYCTVLYCTPLSTRAAGFLNTNTAPHQHPQMANYGLMDQVLYCTVLYCTVLYCTVLYCTVLYCTVLYCTVLYGGIATWVAVVVVPSYGVRVSILSVRLISGHEKSGVSAIHVHCAPTTHVHQLHSNVRVLPTL